MIKRLLITSLVCCTISLPTFASNTLDAANCNTAGNHLPINISTTLPNNASMPILKFSFAGTSNRIVDTGTLTEVQFSGAGNTILVGSTPYQIVQLHFHSPSKTTIDKQHFPLELHIIALSPTKEEVIFSVLFKLGAANPTINTLWQHLPAGMGNATSLTNININYNQLLPSDLSYNQTLGLTKAPCNKKVTWRVLKNYMTVSPVQVAQFKKYSEENNQAAKQ